MTHLEGRKKVVVIILLIPTVGMTDERRRVLGRRCLGTDPDLLAEVATYEKRRSRRKANQGTKPRALLIIMQLHLDKLGKGSHGKGTVLTKPHPRLPPADSFVIPKIRFTSLVR